MEVSGSAHHRGGQRRWWSVLLVPMLAIAACGGDDESSSDESADGSAGDGAEAGTGSAPSGDTTDDRELDPDGSLRFGHPRAPSAGFDPHLSALNHDDVYLGLVYEPLMIENANAELVPGLATDWGFVDDGAAFDLTLREGVTFQDGAAFDAEVVKANIERAQTIEGGVHQTGLAVISEVQVIDTYEVRFHLNGPAAALPRSLSSRPGMMISPNALDAPDLATNPVGAGMFRLVDYREGDRALYERNDDYWNPDDIGVRELEIVLMPDPAARLNALRNDEVDVAAIDPPQRQAADDDGLTTITADGMHRQLIQLNRNRSEFGDVRVRQALNYAIDREAIAESVYEGLATPSEQYYTESFPFGYVPELEGYYAYDPDRARELLAEAGLADGFGFELLVSADPLRERIAEIVQAQWAEIGVDVTLRTVDISQLGNMFYGQLEGDAITAELTGVPEPTVISFAFFDPDQYTNAGGHEIERVTETHEAASASVSDEERAEEVQELIVAMVEEAGMVPIVHPYRVYAMDENVVGFEAYQNGIAGFRGVGMAGG